MIVSRDLDRERLDRALSAAGFDVRSTASAAVGLGLTSSWRPRILVVDQHSPLSVRDLVALQARPGVRVVLLVDGDPAAARDSGADRVVPLAGGAPALLASITQLLSEPSPER
jgi:hypothetical protein